MASKNRIVVIGGTACGPKAAARARRCDPSAKITIIEQKDNLSTATCGLPYYVGEVIKKESALVARQADYFREVMDMEVLTGTRATGKARLEKILVTLDGSKPSEAVLPYIEALASRLKSRVILLNVVEQLYNVYPYTEGLGYYGSAGVVRVPNTEEEMQPAKDVAEKYMKDVNDKLSSKGVKTSYEIRIGSPAEEIIKAEEEMKPDMVAMSTHGHSGFGRFEHGSIADKVLHAGTTPLLLVKPHKP